MKVETAVGKLRGRGYKGTPQRRAVLEALAAEQHQSMGELRERCPQVGMVTVYRTLDLLTEQGLVRRLDLGDGPRYELAENHHHHMICESCGGHIGVRGMPARPHTAAPGCCFRGQLPQRRSLRPVCRVQVEDAFSLRRDENFF